MKKLLLLLVSMLLLFGVSFADTTIIVKNRGTWAGTAIIATPFKGGLVSPKYNGTLNEVYRKSAAATCNDIRVADFSMTGGIAFPIVCRGVFSGLTGTLSGCNLTGGTLYIITLGSGGLSDNTWGTKGSCNYERASNNGYQIHAPGSTGVYTYDYSITGTNIIQVTMNGLIYENYITPAGSDYFYLYGFSYTFGTIQGESTPTTIYYNNGLSSTGFTCDGSSIYLNGLVPVRSLSGTSTVFTFPQNIYRALFRSHP